MPKSLFFLTVNRNAIETWSIEGSSQRSSDQLRAQYHIPQAQLQTPPESNCVVDWSISNDIAGGTFQQTPPYMDSMLNCLTPQFWLTSSEVPWGQWDSLLDTFSVGNREG
jgi:hypothetical protein